MTLTDTSACIAVVLLGPALGVAFIAALTSLRRRRYRGPYTEPYAGFRTAARAGAGELLLECEGHCDGASAHEAAGDGDATCVLCGTTRRIPAPDAV